MVSRTFNPLLGFPYCCLSNYKADHVMQLELCLQNIVYECKHPAIVNTSEGTAARIPFPFSSLTV